VRKQFVADALSAEEAMLRSGKGYRADEVQRYLHAKAAGRKATRPKPKTWR